LIERQQEYETNWALYTLI